MLRPPAGRLFPDEKLSPKRLRYFLRAAGSADPALLQAQNGNHSALSAAIMPSNVTNVIVTGLA
jgi:hypothetical protein